MDLVGFERQADNMTASFIEKIQQKKLVIGVLGIGYVGLPLIVAFAEAGFKTWGLI